jgi:hypothetical protein
VEIHFWILGVLYEPRHSCSRIMMTKLVMFVSLFDDLFDNQSTTEESNMFTRAMDRLSHFPSNTNLYHSEASMSSSSVPSLNLHKRNSNKMYATYHISDSFLTTFDQVYM